MLVDNPVHQHPYFSSSFPDYSTDLSDIFHTELFSTNSNISNSPTSASTSASSRASSPQSPFLASLLTPPQSAPAPSFPDPTSAASGSFFNFLDDDHAKTIDPMNMSIGMDAMPSSAPYDFVGAFGGGGGGDDMNFGLGMNMDPSMDMGLGLSMGGITVNGMNEMALVNEAMGIDPQLVGTPSTSKALSEFDGDDEGGDDHDNDADVSTSPSSSTTSSQAHSPTAKSQSRSTKKSPPTADSEEREKLTLTIAPVKVGGHGKARKGTVQSGGIVKKSSSSAAAVRDKENAAASGLTSVPAYTPAPVPARSIAKGSDHNGAGDNEDDDDDLPHDWRPSPEVFQKMTSKEKRQLRNKISARNFRVRRKEYISTLEGDIAERDRLLDAIRSELGSSQSENLALRQEIAALKRTLLDGRGVAASSFSLSSSVAAPTDDHPLLNLPPPAPLPAQSAAATLAMAHGTTNSTNASTSGSPALALLTPNTQKDLPSTSSGANSRFWGGVGMGMGMGGITPVHRVVLPEMSVGLGLGLGLGGVFGNANAVRNRDVRSEKGSGRAREEEREKLQENVNPMLNSMIEDDEDEDREIRLAGGKAGFEGFADVNPFTMKTLDAYRMHLWGKMAAQHHAHQQHQQLQAQHHQQQTQAQSTIPLTGLASTMRPQYFSTAPLPPMSLSALLAGKHASPSSSSSSSYPSPPPSPNPSPALLSGKGWVVEKLERERERERYAQQQQLQQRDQQTAMYAALASQTLLRRLGSAFWDAFSGASGHASGSVGVGAGAGGSGAGAGVLRAWDADKVRKVLEGTAVVRIVDVDADVGNGAGAGAGVAVKEKERTTVKEGEKEREKEGKRCCCGVTDILEESMRSLSLGKKA